MLNGDFCHRALLFLLVTVIILSEKVWTIWTCWRTSHWSFTLMISHLLDQMNKGLQVSGSFGKIYMFQKVEDTLYEDKSLQ